MPARPSPFLLAAIGSALLVGLVGVIAVGLTYGHPRVNVVVLGWVTVTYSVSGLVAWRCRPANRIGPLMVLTGAGTLVSAMGRAEQGVVHTVGQALDLVPLVMIVHVFLTFPTGRLTGRAEKALIYTGYLAAVPGQITVMMMLYLGARAPWTNTRPCGLMGRHTALTRDPSLPGWTHARGRA